MGKYIFLAALFIVVSIIQAFFLTTIYLEKQSYIELPEVNRKLRTELSKSNRLLQEKTDAMSACLKAVIGEESGFDPMYESVENMSRLEIIAYPDDTESGEPRKFVIQGCQKEEVKK